MKNIYTLIFLALFFYTLGGIVGDLGVLKPGYIVDGSMIINFFLIVGGSFALGFAAAWSELMDD